jgi:hypothetical protein
LGDDTAKLHRKESPRGQWSFYTGRDLFRRMPEADEELQRKRHIMVEC